MKRTTDHLRARVSTRQVSRRLDHDRYASNDAVGGQFLAAVEHCTSGEAHIVKLNLPAEPYECTNFVAGRKQAGSGERHVIESPYFGQSIGEVAHSTGQDVASALQAANDAFVQWRTTPLRERVAVLARFRTLLSNRMNAVAAMAALESGKTVREAAAGIARGIEVIDFATSVHNLDLGGALDVSRGVRCEYRREPLGVVAGITPFNFPAMVPLWMAPIALVAGNAFVLKPSEKVPLTACALADLISEAGFPPGVFSVLHGAKATVDALLSDPIVQAVAFVGSTPVAKQVYAASAAVGQRALCLGGAKNHLIVTPDADPELTVQAVVDSFTGCAGQRCMAGSVLVAVGQARSLIPAIVQRASRIVLGETMGALIDAEAKQRLLSAIDQALADGAHLLLDGRLERPPAAYAEGHWLGPTVLGGVEPHMSSAVDELFGPVLAVVEVANLEQAMALEQRSPFGNATSVFTSSGSVARYVADYATSGMIGVNVGVPVPREPFSFGGSKGSRFGHGDITGIAALEFWSQRKKITTKWASQVDATWMS